MIKEGHKVRKTSGYEFPGVVVSRFTKNDDSTIRFVVECTAEGAEGMLHIFREEQLELNEEGQ